MCAFNSSGMIHAYFQITVYPHINVYKRMDNDPATSSWFYGFVQELEFVENGSNHG
jgi:hypothetical protein